VRSKDFHESELHNKIVIFFENSNFSSMSLEFSTLTPIQFSVSDTKSMHMEAAVLVEPQHAMQKFHSLETEPEEPPPSAFIPSADASASAFMPPRLEKSVSGGTATMSAASSFMSFGEEDTTLDGSKSSFSSAISFNLDFGARQCAHRCTLGSADEVPVLPLSDAGSDFDSHFEDSHECFGRRVESELAKMNAIHMSGDAGGPVSSFSPRRILPATLDRARAAKKRHFPLQHEYVLGTSSGAIKFSVQYFIDMGRRCSLDSITASCMVLRVCPLSVSIAAEQHAWQSAHSRLLQSSMDDSTATALFSQVIYQPLIAAVDKNCRAHPASVHYF